MDINSFVPLKINEKSTDYGINKNGDIYSTISGRILKGTYKSTGSRDVKLLVDGKHKMFAVSQLVAKTFIPNDDNKAVFVKHLNGRKDDDRVSNLKWVRQSTFVKDGIHFIVQKNDFKQEFISRIRALKFIASEVDRSYKSVLNRFSEMKKGYRKNVYGFTVKKVKNDLHVKPNEVLDLKPYKDFVQVNIYGEKLPYMVNKKGEIYSPAKKHNLKPYHLPNSNQCSSVKLRINGKYKGFHVGQIVARTFMPLKDYSNRRLEHINGNNLDNRLSNLKWVEYSLTSKKIKVFVTENGSTKVFNTAADFADYFHQKINLSYARTTQLPYIYSDEELSQKYGCKIRTERYK